MPTIFRSFVSRCVIAGLFVYSFIQVAATLQFLLLPKSDFRVLGLLTIIITIMAVLLSAPLRVKLPFKLVARKDAAALLVVLFFLLPFLLLCVGKNGTLNIVKIGGIQAIDGTNHYSSIAEMAQFQHLTYQVGDYYPKGFHIATAFTEDALHINQVNLSWNANVKLYIGQYLFFGSLLAYVLFYLADLLASSIIHPAKRVGHWLIAFGLGPSLAIFYLLPFIYNGFLNYLYVCAASAAALIFMYEFYEKRTVIRAKTALQKTPLLLNPMSRWMLLGYLILIYGVSMSWPLLIVPLLLVVAYYLVPDIVSYASVKRQLLSWRNVLILLALIFQLLPVYFQFEYSSGSSSQGINLTGGLDNFHYGIILAGLLLVYYLSVAKQIPENAQRYINNVFQPFYIFLGALVAMQYFVVGELRYYVIKSALLVELLLLGLFVALIAYSYLQSNVARLKYFIMVPLIPFVCFMLLIGLTGNPLQNVRDMFRSYSGETQPLYFDQDVAAFAKLGESGKIDHFNTTLLHYDTTQKKFYAQMQIPFWANMMKYTSTVPDFKAQHCNLILYTNLDFGSFTDSEQQALVGDIRDCSALAKIDHEPYYIVTDKASVPYVKALFGNVAVIIT
jgi:hypothetical protein